jgi:uncharacterized repeat protein (TIGR01451 family)
VTIDAVILVPFNNHLNTSQSQLQYNLTYTVNYENAGSLNLTGVKATFVLPSGATFLGPSPQWSTSDGTTYMDTIGSLNSGASGSVQFLIQTPPLPVGSTFDLTVSIADDGTHGPDAFPQYQTATATYVIAPATWMTPSPFTPTPTVTGTITPVAGTPTPGGSIVIQPGQAAFLPSSDGTIELAVPPGATNTEIVLIWSPAPIPNLGPTRTAFYAFDLTVQIIVQQQNAQRNAQAASAYTFSEPIIITAHYNSWPKAQAEESSLEIDQQAADGTWQRLSGAVDTTSQVVSASTISTGRFVVNGSALTNHVYLPIVSAGATQGW